MMARYFTASWLSARSPFSETTRSAGPMPGRSLISNRSPRRRSQCPAATMLAVSAWLGGRPPASATWRIAPRMASLSRGPRGRMVLSAAALPQGFEDADVVGDRGAPHVEYAAHLCLAELHAFRRAAVELHRRHDVHADAGCADRMALGLQAARDVDRQLAVALDPTLVDRPLALAGRGQAHRLVLDQLGRGEAVVAFDEREIEQVEMCLGQRLPPGERRALELDDVALAHRQEVVDVLRGAEGDRLLHAERRADIGQHDRGGAVGHWRAVGALQRTGDERVLVRRRAAELVGEFLLEVGERVPGAVLVRLDGDLGERVGLVAVALEVGR